jgi:hypothetical protein
MSGEPYIDGDTLDQCREAIRQGGKVHLLAGIVGCSPGHLATLLGEPQWKQIPASESKADEFDLFASERLDAVL